MMTTTAQNEMVIRVLKSLSPEGRESMARHFRMRFPRLDVASLVAAAARA